MVESDLFLRALPSLTRREAEVVAGFSLPSIAISSLQNFQRLQIQLIENCWQSQCASLDLRFIKNDRAELLTVLLCRMTRPQHISPPYFRDYCLDQLHNIQQCLSDTGQRPAPIVEGKTLEDALQPFPVQALAELRRREDTHDFTNSEYVYNFYMAYPWEWESQQTWLLADILALLPGTWLLSALLTPVHLTLEEKGLLQYATSPAVINLLGDTGLLGNTLLQHYRSYAQRLQRPFLLKTTLAAPDTRSLTGLQTTLQRNLHAASELPVAQEPGSYADFQTALAGLHHLSWLPWGNLRGDDKKTGRLRYLVDAQGASQIFQLPVKRAAPQKAARKINILFIYAEPNEAILSPERAQLAQSAQSRTGSEARIIRDTIQRCKFRENITLTLCPAAQVRDLRFELLNSEVPFHVIHIASMGKQEGLLFQQEGTGRGKAVPFEALAEYLGRYYQNQKELLCVLINACDTDYLGKLLKKEVPFAITMDGALGDPAAQAFTRGFYDALGSDKGLGTGIGKIDIPRAFHEGRLSAQMETPHSRINPLLFTFP